jgi:hypothetical protein
MNEINAGRVRELADYADLPLPSARAQSISSTLAVWAENANALSKRMSEAQYATIGPATIFRHDCDADELK